MELTTKGCFCFDCGVKKKRIISIADDTLTEREVIGYQFHCGYGYKANVDLLKNFCDISLSEKTFARDTCKNAI